MTVKLHTKICNINNDVSEPLNRNQVHKYLVVKKKRRRKVYNFRCFKMRGNPSIYRQQRVACTNVYCALSERLQLFEKVSTLTIFHKSYNFS